MFRRFTTVIVKPLRCIDNKQFIVRRKFSSTQGNSGQKFEIQNRVGNRFVKLLRAAIIIVLAVDILTIRRSKKKVTTEYSGDRNEIGQKHGHGILKYSDGALYDGDWKNGVMEGFGTFRYANGDVYNGNFANNQPNGRGLIMYKNENIYDGEWKDGLRTGDGTLTFGNGSVYFGNWKNGVPVDAPDGDKNIINVIDEVAAPIEPRIEDSNKEFTHDFTEEQQSFQEPENNFPDVKYNYTSSEDRKD